MGNVRMVAIVLLAAGLPGLACGTLVGREKPRGVHASPIDLRHPGDGTVGVDGTFHRVTRGSLRRVSDHRGWRTRHIPFGSLIQVEIRPRAGPRTTRKVIEDFARFELRSPPYFSAPGTGAGEYAGPLPPTPLSDLSL